jgi:hypothetical protein
VKPEKHEGVGQEFESVSVIEEEEVPKMGIGEMVRPPIAADTSI